MERASSSVSAGEVLNAGCFAVGTKLLTKRGSVAVEEIHGGDEVAARLGAEAEAQGAVAWKPVEAAFRRTGRILHLHFPNGELIRTTPEHPFYVEGKGWTPAGSLKAADRLLTLLGDSVPLSGVDDIGAWEVVYNLRVADYRTDFVGDDTWSFAAWAHNAYLSGADQSVAAWGEQYTRRALALLNLLPPTEHWKVTIAVSEFGGQEIVVLYANPWNSSQPVPLGVKLVPIDSIRNFRNTVVQWGAVFLWAHATTHAEVVLHSNYPAVRAIGLSNPKGPCETCRRHFQQIGWRNIWYPPV